MNRALLGTLGAAALTATLLAAPATAHAAAAAAPATTQITGFTISTKAYGELAVSGKLAATGATVPAGRPLIIETASDTHTAWIKLPIHPGQTALKTKAGGAFAGKYYVQFPHGYYRIRYAGSETLAATLSAEARDSRLLSSVTGFKLSATKIKKGSVVTFTGVLKHKPGRLLVAFPNQRVLIAARLKGSKELLWYARPKTDSKGRFKARIKINKDSYWEYIYPGNAGHYMAFMLKPVFVDVR